MENATKALLIAAGVLVGLMLITLMIIGVNKISDFYTSREENRASEQMIEFNRQYNTYDRKDVRGTDLISLINKILDFNKRANRDGEDIIEIDITIEDNDYQDKFCYKYNISTTNALKLWKNKTYNQDEIKNFIDMGREIENKYSWGIATKLAANISTLLGENRLKTRDQFLQELRLDDVENDDILKYYQYQQFKRAHFDSNPSLQYNSVGRIKKFTFEFNRKFE